MAPVRGIITVDGKPLGTGGVRFTHEQGRRASGRLQPDGTYTLTTIDSGDGAVIGKHRVAVVARTDNSATAAEPEETTSASLIPERYANEAISGLTFEVKPGQQNQADFDLRSQ